tara:strand:- start:283 stop:468 length:186 start_codon:yes stop_codon:yes gene_type:complete
VTKHQKKEQGSSGRGACFEKIFTSKKRNRKAKKQRSIEEKKRRSKKQESKKKIFRRCRSFG